MFTITEGDIQKILFDYGIEGVCAAFSELRRYHYEKDDPASRQVRLIVKAVLESGASFVVRFKNEDDAQDWMKEIYRRELVLLPMPV
jgi:hypothetical protein